MLTHLANWYTNAEVLRAATSVNAELLALSNLRTPDDGKLGVIEQGALADLLVVDGNPLDDIRLIENPEQNLSVIVKDGKVYKNTLQPILGSVAAVRLPELRFHALASVEATGIDQFRH